MMKCLWNGEQIAPTLSVRNAGGAQRMPDKQNFNAVIDEPIYMSDRKGHNGITEDGTATTLTAQEKERPIVFDKEMYNYGSGFTGMPQARAEEIAPTVRADSHPSGVSTSTVRRLTPIECERLQGYPDNWTLIGEPEEVEVKDYDITYDDEGNEVSKTPIGTHTEIEYYYTDRNGKRKRCADSARYKALGNSIALPFWEWLARRISAEYERPVTMGSLFDGIGGFPLAFMRTGSRAVWASEIEDFCIEVTMRRFPE